MKEALLSKERVMFERRPELDFAKGLCIIGMILVHCFEQVLGTWDSGLGTSVVEYLGYPIGAPLFMICMGMTIVFSRRSNAKGLLIRGVALLIVGQVLNFIRYGLVYTISYLLTGDILFGAQMVLLVSSDIMQFAGLSFLLLGLLMKLNVKPLGVFIVSVVLNIAGTLLTNVQTGCYPFDQILGLFWPTATEAYFPLFNWFIFVAAGYAYGHVYVRITNLKSRYAIILPIGLILSGLYYYVSITGDQSVFRIFDGDTGFMYMNLPDGLGCVVVAVTFIGIMWLVSLTGLKLKPLAYVSKNINKYYCVSWCFVCLIGALATAGVLVIDDDVSTVICAIVILALTTLIVMFYKKNMEKKIGPWCSKRIVPIGITVLIVTIVWTGFGYYCVNVATEMMLDEATFIEYGMADYGVEMGDYMVPNMFNNYFDH